MEKEKVKAFVCENGGLTECKVDSRGMLINHFEQAIDGINDISDQLDFYLSEKEDSEGE